MPDIYSTLQQYFGYSTFRPLQESIVKDVLNKQDVFVLMPTGGGKSLCFQLPSLLMEGVTIVVSPLISLMKDQVDSLTQNGINAAYLNSSLSSKEQASVLNKLKHNELSLLYVAPERLLQDSFFQLLKTIPINFFTIDEAHCISQWGHDFRPEYRQLNRLRTEFPEVSLIALTATATPRVKEDIFEKLELRTSHVYQASFNRPNLSYRVIPKNDPFTQTVEYITNHKGESGIIYCQSRKTVEKVAEQLRKKGIKALAYHAGLSDSERYENQDAFIKDDAEVIVATIAFGMGIDKPNVRYVIHYDLPKSLEGYYQETGRAGRDGLPSECLFLYSYADTFSHDRFIREKTDPEERKAAKMQLLQVVNYAGSSLCRRATLLTYFAEKSTQTNCKSCDNCLTPKETFDATILTQKILSCIYRLEERFGINYVVSVLTGSSIEKIKENGHQTLSTYNIITDVSPAVLKTLIFELIQLGYIDQSTDMYMTLSLNVKSRQMLKHKEQVFLTKPVIKEVISTLKKDAPLQNPELFAHLRILRKRLADEANIPPYIIFSDATLKDMCTFLPRTREQLSYIKGVGEQKLENYGELFLAEILSYCEEHQPDKAPVSFDTVRVKKKTRKVHSDKETLVLFRKGLSLEEIAEKQEVQVRTIVGHLVTGIINGEKIDITQFVSKNKQEVIKDAFEKLGKERLAPLKELLGDDYSYEEIQFVRAKLLKSEEVLN